MLGLNNGCANIEFYQPPISQPMSTYTTQRPLNFLLDWTSWPQKANQEEITCLSREYKKTPHLKHWLIVYMLYMILSLNMVQMQQKLQLLSALVAYLMIRNSPIRSLLQRYHTKDHNLPREVKFTEDLPIWYSQMKEMSYSIPCNCKEVAHWWNCRCDTDCYQTVITISFDGKMPPIQKSSMDPK